MKKNFSKLITFLLLTLLVCSLIVACSNKGTNDTTNNKTQTENNMSNGNSTKPPSTNTATEKTFTKDELAKYDGKNGQPAYIAVDGVVYDVTTNFPNGDHHGCVAGTDSTESIKTISHGSAILANSPVVGKLVK